MYYLGDIPGLAPRRTGEACRAQSYRKTKGYVRTLRTAAVALLALVVLAGCTSLQSKWMRRGNPYEEDPFYTKYLGGGSPLDRQISATLGALRQDPWSAPLHNQLGELLLKKGIQKYPGVEFRRAIAGDKRFYPAWYNLGMILEMQDDESGAIKAFRSTIRYKPGHAAAHFQLALLLERRGKTSDAVHHYAEAIRINPHLMSPAVNPRIVDAGLIDRALLDLYPTAHSRYSIQFEPTPPDYPEQPLRFEMANTSEVESAEKVKPRQTETMSGTHYITSEPTRALTTEAVDEIKKSRFSKYADKNEKRKKKAAPDADDEEDEPAEAAEEDPEEDPNEPGLGNW